MKIICTIISLFLILASILLIYLINAKPIVDIPSVNSVLYAIMLAILMFAAGYMLNQGNVEKVRNESTKQLRKAEKAGIDTKESLDKIDRLNAKIETLEVALQEALKHKKS